MISINNLITNVKPTTDELFKFFNSSDYKEKLIDFKIKWKNIKYS